MNHHLFYKGVQLILLSALSLSVIGLVAKLGIQDMSIPSLIFYRFGSAFAFYFLILLAMGRTQGMFRFRETKTQVIRVLLILTSQYCFFYYLQKNSLLNAAALLNTGPIFLALIESKVFGRHVGISSWVGCIVGFLGAILIVQPDEGIFSSMSFIGLLSGITQGASQAMGGRLSITGESHVPPLHFFGICSLVSLIPLLFYPFVSPESKVFSSIDFVWIVLLGIGSIANQLSRARALRYATPARVAPFLYFSVLFAGCWDWLFFGAVPNIISILGIALVIVGGLLKILIRQWAIHHKK